MKKGSYGRSKLIGHSPVQRKWVISTNTTNFENISYLTIFYINCDETVIATVPNIGSPVISIPTNQLRFNQVGSYSYDITKIIQIYNRGCYFFAWVDTLGQIQENQLLITSFAGSENEDCLVYTPAIESQWTNGGNFNTVPPIRGAYIKNPTLHLNNSNVANLNELLLTPGSPVK